MSEDMYSKDSLHVEHLNVFEVSEEIFGLSTFTMRMGTAFLLCFTARMGRLDVFGDEMTSGLMVISVFESLEAIVELFGD
jgi:hypothetical protein